MGPTLAQHIKPEPGKVPEPASYAPPVSGTNLPEGTSGSRWLVLGQLTCSAVAGVRVGYGVVVEPSSSESPGPIEQVTIPRLHGLERHHARVTLNAKRLLVSFWAIIVSKALQTNFPVREGNVGVDHDVDEDTYTVVMRVYSAASAAQTIAFWDSLATELDQWLARLGPTERSIFLNDMALRFHWKPSV